MSKRDEEQHGKALQERFKHKIKGEYFYDGVLFVEGDTSKESLLEIRDFELRDGDILIDTYPKSGSTWMVQIVSLILAKGNIDKANEKPIQERMRFLELFDQYKQLGDMPIESQRCIKSHLPLRMLPKQTTEKKVKVIYVARNPKDTAVSFYHFYRMDKSYKFQGTWDEFFEMYVAGYLVFGDWFEHIKKYWNAKQDETFSQMFITTYEDMHENIFKSIKDVAAFLNVDLDEDTIAKIATESSFDKMKANPNTNSRFEELFDLSKSEFMRKGKVGDWKNYFTINQSEQFDKLFAERMEDCSWKFRFE